MVDGPLQVGKGVVALAFQGQSARELVSRLGGHGMIVAEGAAAASERVAVNLFCFRIAFLTLQNRAQTLHGYQRVRMIRAESAALDVERLLHKFLSLRVLPLNLQ